MFIHRDDADPEEARGRVIVRAPRAHGLDRLTFEPARTQFRNAARGQGQRRRR
jgi:hypothetical protein